MNIDTAKPSETYEGLRRQFMALRTLAASTEQIASGLRRELKDQTQSLADLAAERATNEQLTATLLATEAERDRLKAENEALRKDAERYLWLRDKQTFIWLIQDWFPGAEFTDVDAEIDAAMAKEASRA